jgi:hypothetical protein
MTTKRATLINAFLLVFCLGVPVGACLWFNGAIRVWFPGLQDRALYGEQFGALSTLFSGLACGGVVFTLYLTYQQLRLQHRELDARTNTLQQGQQQLAEQTRLLADQFSEIAGFVHPMVDAEVADEIAKRLFDHTREALENEIRGEHANPKRQQRLREALGKFLPAATDYIEAHSNMVYSLYHNPAATHATAGTIKSTARHTEEIARLMGDWAKNIRENRELQENH